MGVLYSLVDVWDCIQERCTGSLTVGGREDETNPSLGAASSCRAHYAKGYESFLIVLSGNNWIITRAVHHKWKRESVRKTSNFAEQLDP